MHIANPVCRCAAARKRARWDDEEEEAAEADVVTTSSEEESSDEDESSSSGELRRLLVEPTPDEEMHTEDEWDFGQVKWCVYCWWWCVCLRHYLFNPWCSS